jgi:hypothetical protein
MHAVVSCNWVESSKTGNCQHHLTKLEHMDVGTGCEIYRVYMENIYLPKNTVLGWT